MLSYLFAACMVIELLMCTYETCWGIDRICCTRYLWFLGLLGTLLVAWAWYSAFLFSAPESYKCERELTLLGFSATIMLICFGVVCACVGGTQLLYYASARLSQANDWDDYKESPSERHHRLKREHAEEEGDSRGL